MSEGEHTIADEQAVVGEPASLPHHAVVVGEPPEDMSPVLGEPVPLANGPPDQPPISSDPPALQPSVNGVQPPTLQQDDALPTQEILSSSEPPSQQSVSPLPVHDDTSAAAVSHPSQSHHQPTPPEESSVHIDPEQACAEESTNVSPSDVRGLPDDSSHDTEPPITVVESGPHADESPDALADVTPTSGETEIPAEESPATSDALSDVTPTAGDTEIFYEEPPVTSDALTDAKPSEGNAEVSHIVETSPPPASEVPTENPYDVLEPHSYPNVNLSSDQSGVVDCALVEKPTSGDASAGDAPAVEAESCLAHKDEESKPEEESTGELALSQTDPEDEPAKESAKEILVSDIANEEAFADQVIQRDSPRNDSGAHDTSAEVDKVEEHVKPEEAPGGEVHIEEFPSSGQGVPLDASISKETRSIAFEECIGDQASMEEPLPPAANGKDDFQHEEGANHVEEREQDLPKDDNDCAECPEKSSFRRNIPLIVTGLAIAAVGVAVASISRPR